MSEDDYSKRYRLMQMYVGWTDDDARRVAALWPLVSPHAPGLIEDFYAEIQRHPDASHVITGGAAQIERLSRMLREWLEQLLAGAYDEAYMARRWKVGYRHVEIGLAQRFTSLALSRLRVGVMRCVCTGWRGSSNELAAALVSLNKLIDLDHAHIQDAYEYEYVRRERLLERERGERKFQHLVESASCLIVILGSDYSAAYFNPYAEVATGYAASEIRSQTNRALSILGRDQGETRIRLAGVLNGQGPMSYEAQIEGRDGPPRWINWSLSRIDDFDDGPAVLAVGHDVTEQRQSAAQLLQASRLATIGEMYARLAHESRNALQRLRVCTEMLGDQLTDRPETADLVERSAQAQDDLRHLLDEVRNFASPLSLERTECRLPTLWREAWNLLQVPRKGRAGELIDDTQADMRLPALQLDRFRMVQAFRNIFENCVAAGREPATVRVACSRTALHGREEVEVSIQDNGPGFDDIALHQAFDPFFTTKTTGTGLGLSIVRRIIEAHGGQATATNAPGGGAKITLFLPCESSANLTARDTAAAKPYSGSPHD